MQTAPPNLLADYLYLRQTAVVKQAIDTARTSVPSGGHSSSYLCQQDSVFAAQDRRLAAAYAFGLPNTVDPHPGQKWKVKSRRTTRSRVKIRDLAQER